MAKRRCGECGTEVEYVPDYGTSGAVSDIIGLIGDVVFRDHHQKLTVQDGTTTLVFDLSYYGGDLGTDLTVSGNSDPDYLEIGLRSIKYTGTSKDLKHMFRELLSDHMPSIQDIALYDFPSVNAYLKQLGKDRNKELKLLIKQLKTQLAAEGLSTKDKNVFELIVNHPSYND